MSRHLGTPQIKATFTVNPDHLLWENLKVQVYVLLAVESNESHSIAVLTADEERTVLYDFYTALSSVSMAGINDHRSTQSRSHDGKAWKSISTFITAEGGGGGREETINDNQQEAHWRLGKYYHLYWKILVYVDLCHNKSMQQIKQHWSIARPTMLSTGLTEQKPHSMSRCIDYSTLQYSRVHLYYRKITLESIFNVEYKTNDNSMNNNVIHALKSITRTKGRETTTKQ